jgi:hypothetical protein
VKYSTAGSSAPPLSVLPISVGPIGNSGSEKFGRHRDAARGHHPSRASTAFRAPTLTPEKRNRRHERRASSACTAHSVRLTTGRGICVQQRWPCPQTGLPDSCGGPQTFPIANHEGGHLGESYRRHDAARASAAPQF